MLDSAQEPAPGATPLTGQLPALRVILDASRRAVRGALIGFTLVVTAVVGLSLGATALGYDLFVIDGGSMSPSVRAGALVISERTAPDALRPGDVITFRRASAPDAPVTHRVIRVEQAGGISVWTKGDANAVADPEPLTGVEPVSRMRLNLPMAGYLLSFMQTRAGQVALIALPLLAVLVRAAGAMRSTAPAAAAPGHSAPMWRPRLPHVAGALTRLRVPQIALVWRWSDVPRPRLALPSLPRRASARGSRLVEVGRAARARHAVEAPAQLSAELATRLAEALQPVGRLAGDLERREAEFEAAMARSLLPMTEYADRLERSLERLIERLGPENLVAGSPLARQVVSERARLLEVRAAIEEAKEPLRLLLRREGAALDAVLAPFDQEVATAELLLRQQRKHLMSVLSGLQSEDFRVALDLLERRSDDLHALASEGETDPAAVATRLAEGAPERAGSRSPHVQSVVAALLRESLSSPDGIGRGPVEGSSRSSAA